MAVLYVGNPLNGTSDDDFLFDYPANPADNTLNGLAGDDLLIGDSDFFFAFGNFGTSSGTAFDITSNTAPWSTLENTMVLNDTTIPHTTIQHTSAGGAQAWWSITVGAGAQITLDIDFGRGVIGGDTDTYVEIIAGDGTTVLAFDDDGPSADVGSISTAFIDSFLQYTFGAGGTYYIHVREFGGDGNFEAGDSFILNVSLTGQGVTNTDPEIGNDTLNGGANDDTLFGNAGHDTLDGGTGADTMYGGTGNDEYVVNGGGDVVFENEEAGDDLVRSSVTYALTAHVEDLTLTGGAANGTGNGLDNSILGNDAANQLRGGAGDDTLNGAGGADTMLGGSGWDTYIVNNAGDRAIESSAFGGLDLVRSSINFTLGANLEHLTLTGAGNINGTGNALDNEITGNNGDNTLVGGAGADVLKGNGGADTMSGGADGDSYYIGLGDTISEGVNQGMDWVYVGRNYTLLANFENVVLLGAGNFNANGNAADNTIYGNSGENTLRGFDGDDWMFGGAGDDTMEGGDGDDTYYVIETGDVVTELANEGTDTVLSAVNRQLGANQENLELIDSSAVNGTGNTLNNVIVGSFVANTLRGMGGNDTLEGGFGHDTLFGGAGADRFVLQYLDTYDDVMDFQVGTDKVRINNYYFDGLTSTGALAASAFRLGADAVDASDRIMYNAADGGLYYDGDGAGGAAKVLIAVLDPGLALTASDIVVFSEEILVLI